MAGGPTPPQSPARNGNKMSGAVSSSPRVRLTMKRFQSMEAGACSNPEDVQPATKKAAQKLTNFRGYLHKSSVAGCFVDLLEMTNEGVMTEAGLYPSSRYKQSRNMRQSGLGSSSRSRPLTGLNGLNKHDKSQAPLQGPSNNQAEECKNQQHQRGHHGRRPSTALQNPTAPLATQPTRDAPLSARVGLSAGNSFAGAVGARILTASSPSCHNNNNNKSEDIAGSRATTLDIQRTQWVEGDSKQGVGGWLEADTAGQSQQQQGQQQEQQEQQQQQRVEAVSATGPETNDDAEEGENEGRNGGGGDDESGADHAGGRCNTSSTTSTSTADSPKPFSRRVAWGKAMRELSSTMTKVTHMKAAADRAVANSNSSHERRARAVSVRAGLIEGELLRAQAALVKNENRKRRATEAAALVASQRGLLEAIILVVATKRLWAGSLKLLQDREHLAQLGIAATVVQRAYKAYTNRRMFKVLLAIRRVHLRLYIGMNIRRKQMAATKMQWFLATGSGGAKARPRKVIRAFMYQVRRCQRAAREWLACRAATIEAVCRLWDRIESEIRRGLGDELDRAKRVWVKNALRTGEDSHIHGQWRELKAKTRSLVARIDRLEAQMERQQTRDKKARVQAARSMLKRRSGVTRGHRKATQMDSAENLRSSTVPSSKRLAIIRSSLNAKFSLHQQGGRRVERTGNKVIGEMDARAVIRGEFPDAPPDDGGSEGAAAATSSAALTVARSTKRSRALIYTGDLGRSWQQIVEDTVMQDFRRNAFARKDSMPYLQYSVVLSLDMMAATGNTDGPSASAMAATAAAAAAAPTGDATTANGSGREVLGRASIGSTASSGLEQRRRRGREGSAGGGGSGAARVVLEPII